MKKKITTHNIITILLFVCIAFFIAGQFSPISYYNYSEFASETFNDWTGDFELKEASYFLFHYRYICDKSFVSIGEKTLVQEKINLFYFLPIYLTYDELPSAYNADVYEASSHSQNGLGIYMARIASLLSFAFALLFLYYFLKFLKEFKKKSTKTPLFLGFFVFSVIVIIHLSNRFFIDSTDSIGLGMINYVKLGYGFYYQLVVAVILFFIYFIQNKPKFLKNIF